MMREMETTGKDAKKPGQKMTRKEALESFKKIRDIASTQIMRVNRQCLVKSLKQAGVDSAMYLPGLAPDPFPGYTDEDLQNILETINAERKQ